MATDVAAEFTVTVTGSGTSHREDTRRAVTAAVLDGAAGSMVAAKDIPGGFVADVEVPLRGSTLERHLTATDTVRGVIADAVARTWPEATLHTSETTLRELRRR